MNKSVKIIVEDYIWNKTLVLFLRNYINIVKYIVYVLSICQRLKNKVLCCMYIYIIFISFLMQPTLIQDLQVRQFFTFSFHDAFVRVVFLSPLNRPPISCLPCLSVLPN